MGNLYDYFAAPNDQSAAETLENSPDRDRFAVVEAKGVDPIVQIATLESLLRGVEYDTVRADPRQAKLLTDPEAEGAWVVTVTDTLRDALAAASDDELARVAVPWSRTDEFWGQGDPDLLTELLGSFAGLAREAQDRQERLYCWISL